MKKSIVTPLFLGTLVAFFYGASASAQDQSGAACSAVVEIGLQRGLSLPNYGVDVAPGKAVTHDRVAVTCNHFTGEAGGSALLSGSGTYGHRGPVDEQWLKGAYGNEVGTAIGTFSYEASLAYHVIDLGQGLKDSGDDYVALAAEIGYPLEVRNWKVTPSIGVDKYIPVGHNNPLYWQKARLRIKRLNADGSMFYVDGESVHNVNSTTAVIHKNVWEIEAGYTKPLGHGWTGTAGLMVTQYGNSDRHFRLFLERDGRMTPFRKSGPMPDEKRGVNPFLRFTHTH